MLYHLHHLACFLSQRSDCFHCVPLCRKLDVQIILSETKGEYFAIFFPSISPCSLLLEQLYQGKPLWFGTGSLQAETPILDNCSEMCLCRGACGNELTTNIITVLEEVLDREGRRQRETQEEGDDAAEREKEGENEKCLCKKRSW